MKTMDPLTLKTHLDNQEVCLIDVREPNEYSQNHISGSILVPLSSVSHYDFTPYLNQKIVMQCRSGARSAAACQILQDRYDGVNVYNLTGGIMGWMSQGLPVNE